MSTKAILRNIHIRGKLGTLFGREFRLAVNSPAEAVRALCAQIKGFEAYLMASKERGIAYAVFVGKKNIGESELTMHSSEGDISIAPVPMGAKRGGIFQIIFGAVLVVVGVLISPFAPTIGAYLVKMGITMIMGGIVQLLSPQPKNPKSKDDPNNTPNYAFNGPINTQAQGHPVPVGYGRLIIGSAVISGGITSSDSVLIPSSAMMNPVYGNGGGASTGGTAVEEWYNRWRNGK